MFRRSESLLLSIGNNQTQNRKHSIDECFLMFFRDII